MQSDIGGLAATLGGAYVAVLVFLFVMAVLWFFVPFAVYGLKPLIRDAIAEQRAANALLRGHSQLLKRNNELLAWHMRRLAAGDDGAALEPLPESELDAPDEKKSVLDKLLGPAKSDGKRPPPPMPPGPLMRKRPGDFG